MTRQLHEVSRPLPAAPPGAEHLRAWLADHDAPCPVCSYNLRGLADGSCPECHAELALSISSPRTNPGAWVLAIVGLAMGMGFDAVVLTLLTTAVIIEGPSTPSEVTFAVVMLTVFGSLTAACATVLFVVFRSRPKWAFRPRKKQWQAAAWTIAVTFLVHACVGAGLALLNA